MVVVRAEDSALATDQFLAGLTEIDEGTLMMDAVDELGQKYAGATGVWEMEEISDWPSAGFFDFVSFLVGVLDASLSLPLEPDFSLPLDLDLDAPDLSDLF